MTGQCTADRRRALRFLIGESLALGDELRGRPQFRLSELGELSDEAIAQLVPRIDPAVEILVDEREVRARRGARAEGWLLFAQRPENRFVFNRFNAQTAVGQIAHELAAALSWDEESAFVHVRDFFLRLVRLGVCLPLNHLEP